jgi:hypothetical protein
MQSILLLKQMCVCVWGGGNRRALKVKYTNTLEGIALCLHLWSLCNN